MVCCYRGAIVYLLVSVASHPARRLNWEGATLGLLRITLLQNATVAVTMNVSLFTVAMQ